jgi:membrane-associated phospholipid phosphatase
VRTTRPSRPRRGSQVSDHRRLDGWIALGSGLAYVTLGAVSARRAPDWEKAALLAANRRGDAPLLRLPQQLGTPWTLPALALLGFSTRRPHLAVAGALALPLEKVAEVGVKKLSRRRRPAQVSAEVELHDDAPATGESYPSGHAAISACAAVLVSTYLPAQAWPGLAVPVGLTSYTRVHQGAHFPLDAVGGLLLGVGLGTALRFAVGVPPA